MSHLERFLIFPLRYYPNLATGEFLNVGVGLVAPEAKWWGVRVVRSFRGFNRIFPTSQPQALRSTLAKIDREASRRAPALGPNLLLEQEGWPYPRKPLEELVSGNRGALRWGDVLMEGATTDLVTELEHWYGQFVQIRKEGTDAQPAIVDDGLLGTLRSEFERRGLLARLKSEDIGSYHTKHFPYTYRNGVLNVFDSINLDFRSQQPILDRGQLWRGSLDILGEAEQGMKFFALVRLPHRRGLREDADLALTMIQRAHSVKVETYPVEEVEELGRRASQVMASGNGSSSN